MRRRRLLLGAGLFMLLAVAVALYSWLSLPPSPAARIRPGMTQEEVGEALNQEPGPYPIRVGVKVQEEEGRQEGLNERWYFPNGYVEVQYDSAGRVRGAEFEPDEPPTTFLDRLRRLLPW